jgi:SAM-dependent methyltransferase
MPDTQQANRDQAALWNGASGEAWVEMQRVLDEALAPFGTLLLEQALHNGPSRVLDIGCGAGATAFSAAQRIGQTGSCLGVDISAPLIALARQRAVSSGVGNATFVHADAQTHLLGPRGARVKGCGRIDAHGGSHRGSCSLHSFRAARRGPL